MATVSWAEALGFLLGVVAFFVSALNLIEAFRDLEPEPEVPLEAADAAQAVLDRLARIHIRTHVALGETMRMVHVLLLTAVGFYGALRASGEGTLRADAWVVPLVYVLVQGIFLARTVNDLLMRRRVYEIYHEATR